MEKQPFTNLGNGGYAVTLPGVILAFDPADDADFKLSGLISANPGMPVVILCTRYDSAVFSQAETTDRTFVFSQADIKRSDVPAGSPVSWLSPGDVLPDLPGDVEVTAVGSGFLIYKTDDSASVFFSPRKADAVEIVEPVTIAIVPENTDVKAQHVYYL